MNIPENPFAEKSVMNSSSLVCLTDLDLKIAACSNPWTKIFPDEGIRSLDEVFPENKSSLLAACKSISDGSFLEEISVQKVYHFETQKYFELSIYPYFQGYGIWGYLVNAKEVKFNFPNFEPVEILNQKFNDVFNYAVVGMAIVSLSGRWIEVNAKLCEMVGYTPEELKQLSFQDITHPDDLDKDLELLEQLVQAKIATYQIEKRYYHKNGHFVWVNLGVSMVYDEQKNPSYFISQIEDISVTKKALETIRENQNIFRGIFHSSYQFTALITTDGKIMEINDAALGFFGLTMKEFAGKPFWEIPNWKISQKHVGKLRKNIQKAAKGEFIHSEETLWDNLKNLVRIDFTMKPVFDEKKKVVSIVTEGKIIQEIIDARMRLLESEQKLRTFFNLAPVGFVVNDLETGEFIEFNDAILENTGYGREDFMRFSYNDLFPEEFSWVEPTVIEKLMQNGVYGPIELEYMHSNGLRFPILINGMLNKDSTGRRQIWSVVQDISSLKQAEQELQQLNKEIEAQNLLLSASNDELEQFAYVASHDLQEPLRMISGFLTLLNTKYKDQLDDKARQYIHFAVDGATRMRQIIIDILEYSKIDKDETEQQVTDLEKVVRNTVELFSGTIKEKEAEINWESLPKIYAQKSPIQQLFRNLVSNALKYHAPGIAPKINISVREFPDRWEFCVADNGIGISDEFHKKIFVLFSRLNGKRDYDGTGIGLALCKKIVEKHGGNIWVESALDAGSRFYFTLAKQHSK